MGDYARATISFGGEISRRTILRLLSESSDIGLDGDDEETALKKAAEIFADGEFEDDQASGAMFSDFERDLATHGIEFDRFGCHPEYGDFHGCYRRGWNDLRDLKTSDGDPLVTAAVVLGKIEEGFSAADLKQWLEDEYVVTPLTEPVVLEDCEDRVVDLGDDRAILRCSPGEVLVRLYDDGRLSFCPLNEQRVPSPLYVNTPGWMVVPEEDYTTGRIAPVLRKVAEAFDSDLARSLMLKVGQ